MSTLNNNTISQQNRHISNKENHWNMFYTQNKTARSGFPSINTRQKESTYKVKKIIYVYNYILCYLNIIQILFYLFLRTLYKTIFFFYLIFFSWIRHCRCWHPIYNIIYKGTVKIFLYTLRHLDFQFSIREIYYYMFSHIVYLYTYIYVYHYTMLDIEIFELLCLEFRDEISYGITIQKCKKES